MKTDPKKILAMSFVLVVAGCGGGGGSGFNTGVPNDKPLNQLSAAQATALCTNSINYVNAQFMSPAFHESQCRAVGIAFASLSVSASTTDAQLQQACAAGYALCQAAPADAGSTAPSGDAGAPTDACATAMAQLATCTATGAQYSACVSESVHALQTAFPPCNQLTQAKLTMFTGDGGTSSSSGPACALLNATCPGINTSTMMTKTGALRAAQP